MPTYEITTEDVEYLRHGDWRPLITLSVGALICGFFWEMWNYYSYPKWIYHTPGAQFLHIFEQDIEPVAAADALDATDGLEDQDRRDNGQGDENAEAGFESVFHMRFPFFSLLQLALLFIRFWPI